MNELEKVEKLREKADITFAEAKEALEKSNGDLLDALIYLEREGKVPEPSGGGSFSGESKAETSDESPPTKAGFVAGDTTVDFADLLKRFGNFCLMILDRGLNNHLVARKGDQQLFCMPVIIVALLLLIFFWVTGPLFILSLFCGFRYSFSGKEFGRDTVNKVMDSASNVAEDVKRSFTVSDNNNNEDDDN